MTEGELFLNTYLTLIKNFIINIFSERQINQITRRIQQVMHMMLYNNFLIKQK